MTIYTVSNTNSSFTIYHDDIMVFKRMICLLSISLNFKDQTIPEVVNVHCNGIDTNQRLLNGKRSDLLIQVINSKKDNISYNSNHKQFIELISKDYLSNLTFILTSESGELLDNLKSVQMDLELI